MAKKEVTETITPVAEPTVAPTAATAAPAKKTNTALIVTIVLVVLVGIPAIGFGAFWYFVGRKVDNFTNNLNNGEVNLSLGDNQLSVNTNDDQEWPDSIPDFVPEYNSGNIASSGKIGATWAIDIEGSTKTDAKEYRTKLGNDGWELMEPVEMGSVYSFAASKNDYTISLSLSTDENNKTAILYSVSKDVE